MKPNATALAVSLLSSVFLLMFSATARNDCRRAHATRRQRRPGKPPCQTVPPPRQPKHRRSQSRSGREEMNEDEKQEGRYQASGIDMGQWRLEGGGEHRWPPFFRR